MTSAWVPPRPLSIAHRGAGRGVGLAQRPQRIFHERVPRQGIHSDVVDGDDELVPVLGDP